jgi:hypothetical protein
MRTDGHSGGTRQKKLVVKPYIVISASKVGIQLTTSQSYMLHPVEYKLHKV